MDERIARSMRVKQLKTRVEQSAYVVDPDLVAEAMLRHFDARRDPLTPRALRRPRDARGPGGDSGPRRPAS